jgi:hypothetical protein
MTGITGVFEADFSKFKAAVDDANVSLKGFQDNGDKGPGESEPDGRLVLGRQDRPVISSAPWPS